ncbi:membrane metalloprotease [Lacinutrix sp. MedPE-SW]|uniref:membrane metalloprotease n=1 Tax=Lacinutrix sp. MedPE-SW TaxID=1860087 RepID=UPI00091AC86A|nr:membrane metalloprotease [Lacinutrix sp. MedPE-SW]OIQ21907.1 MAG: membrane metalloprotease [Lacinutrix sp. MedPE-SW]
MKKNTYFIIILLFITSFSCSKDDESNGTENTIDYHLQNVGASSKDLLSDTQYKSLVIELIYVEGFEPTQQAVNNIVAFFNERTYKPNGITVQKRSIPSPGLSPYTTNEVRTIEDNNRTIFNTEDQLAVWALYIDGLSASNSQNSSVLGTAYRNTSFVIYEESIHNLSDDAFEPSRQALETTVTLHEIGHIFGLTNLGAPLQSNHEDEAHPKHCDETNCLMFWKTETTNGVMDMVSGDEIPQLDAQCIADLQANGGK